MKEKIRKIKRDSQGTREPEALSCAGTSQMVALRSLKMRAGAAQAWWGACAESTATLFLATWDDAASMAALKTGSSGDRITSRTIS